MSAWTTQGLLAAQKQGAVVRTRGTGQRVVHRPRHRGDRRPWLLIQGSREVGRFTAAECRPEGANGGPWALARLLRF